MATPDSAAAKAPVHVTADSARRRLWISFHGKVTAADVHAALKHVQESIAQLGCEFSVLTDLSELQEMSIDAARDITRVMDLCLEAGVKQIVRVIPDPAKDIGFHLLSMTHYRGRVPIATCENLAEAERVLSSP